MIVAYTLAALSGATLTGLVVGYHGSLTLALAAAPLGASLITLLVAGYCLLPDRERTRHSEVFSQPS
jgi:hypothetical protein